MGGNKHKQTKKKSALVVKESKTKKKDLGDIGGAGGQADSCLEKEPGRCCLPVGMIRIMNDTPCLKSFSQMTLF